MQANSSPVPTASTATSMSLIAAFAALIAGCSLIPAIPVGILPVPITLQTFAVLLAGAVLGWWRGLAAVALYLAVGFAGLPVFAQGGATFAVLAKPSVGFLLAFPLGAALCGWLTYRALRRRPTAGRATAWIALAALAGTAVIHAAGIVGMSLRLGLSLTEAAVADAVFLPGDLIKVAAVAVIAAAVHRAFPDLT